jgi:carboxyl-terminal processing protease
MRMRATVLLALAAACVAAVAADRAPAKLPTLLTDVRETLEERYYKPVSEEVLRQPTVDATLEALGDPYTEYLGPRDVQELRRVTSGRYSGIGVTVSPFNGGLLVTSAPPGPARSAGIRPGDLIVKIDGLRTADMTFQAATTRILGDKGSVVVLTVRRQGTLRTFSVVRELVEAPVVTGKMQTFFDRRVGIIRVHRFVRGTAAQVGAQAVRFDKAGVDGIILDMRSNPGGLLDEAVGVVSVFAPNVVVATVTGAHEPRRTLRSSDPARLPDIPLVVVVNRYSASASEVVTAALKDAGRAIVVGEDTFGKALVQDVEPLVDGGALKLTVARYLTAKGRDISATGVTPDVKAYDDPSTLRNEALADAVAALPEP